MTTHRDTNEGLYARLAEATDHALSRIKDIHESLPSGADRPARVELLKALETVRNEAWTHYRINATNLVSEEAFNEVREHLHDLCITKGWVRSVDNRYDLRFSLDAVFSDLYDISDTPTDGTGFVRLALEVTILDNETEDVRTIVKDFLVSPYDGESLWSAVSTARHEAWSFLAGIKAVHNI